MKQITLKKAMDILLILVFVGIIIIPLICINTDPNKISIVQNKGLSKMPHIKGDNGINFNYINEFNAYINDNIGFREQANIFRLAKMYQLFRKVDVPNFIEGKEQHMFQINSGEMIETFLGHDLLTQEQLQRFDSALEEQRKYFESTGAKFYFMTIPDKEQIYPEYYPSGIQRFVDISKIDQIDEYLKANYRDYAFCVKQPLLDSKGDKLLYYRNRDGSHWNMNGAFVGYQEIMQRLKEDFPQLKVFSKEDFNITEKKSLGAPVPHLEAIEYLCKVYNFDDTIYDYHLKEDNSQSRLIEDLPQTVTFSNNDYVYRHYTNPSSPNAPKLLVMGDSYIRDFLLPILSKSFSEIYYIGGYGGKLVESDIMISLQQEFQADIVLYEFVEKVFHYNIYVPEIEKFEKMKSVDFPYINLKKEAAKPELYIDIPSQEIQGQLKFNSSSNIGEIKGWALDNYSQAVWGELYAKIGDKYYKAERFERPDIEQSSGKPDYLMCGFSFNIPIAELLNSDKIEFIVISNDKTYQYEPAEFSISVE